MSREAVLAIEEVTDGTNLILPDTDVSRSSKSSVSLFAPALSESEQFKKTHSLANQKELIALQRLDDKCVQLQQEGCYAKALECLEKGLVLRQHSFGSESDEVWTCCRKVGEICNLLAMTYLQQDSFRDVLELLKKAEILTKRFPAGRAVTLNNLACYYRRQGNLHKALDCLKEAFKIEARLENLSNKADTHLNMCAVLSQLGKHQSALSQAQSALVLLHEELQLGHVENIPTRTKNDGESSQEFLRCWDLSLQSYKRGKKITTTYLGESHGIVTTLQKSLLSVKRNMESSMRKTDTREEGISLPSLSSSRGACDFNGLESLVTYKTKARKSKTESSLKLPLAHSNNGNSSNRL
ncbi:putative tetratricopeptide-like helical domain superfamily, acetyltransferase A, auxiliary subunit [Plasmopara halstedii]